MDIGHALKLCRSARKVSLDELASSAGLSQSYLSMVESGKREPTLSTLEKLANVLEVPLPILLFLASNKEELKGLDSETFDKLSTAALAVIQAQ